MRREWNWLMARDRRSLIAAVLALLAAVAAVLLTGYLNAELEQRKLVFFSFWGGAMLLVFVRRRLDAMSERPIPKNRPDRPGD
jgi:peptidoglycan/LPS O-acetylase OafA/YrhL